MSLRVREFNGPSSSCPEYKPAVAHPAPTGPAGVEVSDAQQVNRTRTVPLISVGLAWSGTT